MSFAFVLIWVGHPGDILHEFWSFSIIYILVYNCFKLRVLSNGGRLVDETQMYKPLALEC